MYDDLLGESPKKEKIGKKVKGSGTVQKGPPPRGTKITKISESKDGILNDIKRDFQFIIDSIDKSNKDDLVKRAEQIANNKEKFKKTFTDYIKRIDNT